MPRTFGKLLAALPQYPHSVMMSVLSTLFLRDPFAPEDAERIRGKVVCLNVRDAGIRIKLRIDRDGYLPCPDSTEPHVTVSAGAREKIRAHLKAKLAPAPGGPIELTARAWAVQGVATP